MAALLDKITKEDQVPIKNIPVNYGLLGDLEHDCNLLNQLLNIEIK